MRFAYIDSQGNEVPIPGVDALALRIELGAVGPDTELYDASTERWGPAHTHEIFHTLSRERAEEKGFVAPPPPVPSRPAPEASAAPGPIEDPSAGAGPAPPSLDFTLAGDVEPAAPDTASGSDSGSDEPAPFDFGGMEALELEGGPGGVEEAGEVEDAGGAPTPELEDADALGLEGGFGGGMELEEPLSAFSGPEPPGWMESSGPPVPADDDAAGEAPDVMTFGAPEDDGAGDGAGAAPAAAEIADEEAPARPPRPRPEPRSRPSPPRRRPKRSPMVPLVGVVAAAALGAGGWYGYRTFAAGGAAPRGVVEFHEVTIPDIPAELLPTMRDLGERALVGAVADLGAVRGEVGLDPEPRGDWLAGVYLANASRFADVEAYWEAMGAFVDRVRDDDDAAFHDRYLAELGAAGLTGDTAALLLARADSGFLATRRERFEAYAAVDELVRAALDLHRFLLDNEARIDHDPAAGGVSRDPVLEAVPETPELGEGMWGMVARITTALDALGTLDRVTTDRLTAVLFDRIRRAGFR